MAEEPRGLGLRDRMNNGMPESFAWGSPLNEPSVTLEYNNESVNGGKQSFHMPHTVKIILKRG